MYKDHILLVPRVVFIYKFHCTLKIEKVQYRALKYAFNNFNCSYDVLRRVANVLLLNTRRKKTVLLEVYKAYLSYEPQYLYEMFEKQGMSIILETIKLLYSTNAILQRMAYRYMVLSMK